VECPIEPFGIARTHRSALVNVRRIVELCHYAKGAYRVLLRAVPEAQGQPQWLSHSSTPIE
jgi:DNA-binding LytR/AlgR family response regulator